MKYIIICIIAICVTQNSSAQTQINPVIGINVSSLTNEPEGFNSEGRLGWHFGANLRVGDQFFFQPGIHYAQLNSTLSSVDDGQAINQSSFSSNIGVIRIPLLAGLRLMKTKEKDSPFNINVHAGVVTEFVLSVDESNTGLTKDDFNSPIFAVVAGLGIDILFLTLDIDYEIGLSPVFDNSENDSLTDITTDPKSNAFIISVGGKFQF